MQNCPLGEEIIGLLRLGKNCTTKGIASRPWPRRQRPVERASSVTGFRICVKRVGKDVRKKRVIGGAWMPAKTHAPLPETRYEMQEF